jgi:imidazoleglycerol-phosphate dehydratase
MVEALFKSFARAARAAAQLDPRVTGVPSTKGTLTA